MSKLDEVIAGLNKKFKSGIITTSKDESTFSGKERVSFDNPSLSYLFFGGFIVHTLWEISGAYSSGKSALSMYIAGKFQKHYKDKWNSKIEELQNIESPTKQQSEQLNELLSTGHKRVVWLDSEHSLTDYDWATKNGLDVDDLVYIKPQEESAEQLLDVVLALIESGEVCLVVIDSLAALTSGAALAKQLDEKTYCGIAAPLTTWTGKVLSMLNRYDCSIICINQQRDTLNSMFPSTHTPGGRAFQYGTHVRLELRKGKALDEKFNEIPQKEDTYWGQTTEIQILKNKVTNPSRRMSKITITFDKGIYSLNDTINQAISIGLIRKAGAWFSIQDADGNVKVHENGDTMKWQGLANVIKYMQEHPEVYQEVYDAVNEIICRE